MTNDNWIAGDRVTRKNVNAFRYMQGINGTIVYITYDDRCYIRWDTKASTGQQHSTIQKKYLTHLNDK